MNISQNKNSDLLPSQQDMKELENLHKLRQFNHLENKARQLLNKYTKNINLQNFNAILETLRRATTITFRGA